MYELPSPIAGSDRNEILDVLRGVAVLGILMVNIQGFAQPFQTVAFP